MEWIKAKLPGDPRIPWTFGQAYYMRRQYPLAANAFQEAVNMRAGDRQSWNMLGRSLADNGNYKESIIALDQVLKIDTTNPWAHYIKGRALEELNQASEAKQAMDAYERFRDDYSSWNRRWNYRMKKSIDHRETYPIHWHPLRYTSERK